MFFLALTVLTLIHKGRATIYREAVYVPDIMLGAFSFYIISFDHPNNTKTCTIILIIILTILILIPTILILSPVSR